MIGSRIRVKAKALKSKNKPDSKKESGVALISVLLIFAIAAILATRMMSQGSIQAERAGGYQQQQQLEAYARGGESYAIALLKEDWQQDQAAGDKAYDHPSEPWGQLDRFALDASDAAEEGDNLRIRILPLDGYFNINNLLKNENEHTDARHLSGLRRLLAANQIPEVLADQALDWIDSNNIPTGLTGAEDNDYLLQKPAYRTADQYLLDTDELMLLTAALPQNRYRMSELLVALPAHTPLNLNAANPEALAALLAMSVDQATQLLGGIEYTPVVSVNDFLAARSLDAGLAELFSIRSQYFMVTSQVDWLEQRLALTTLLHRDLESGKITILQRRFQPVSQQRFSREVKQ